MLLLFLSLLPLLGCGSRVIPSQVSQRPKHEEAAAVETRPHIYNCRSPNMEVFTCWWNPLENLTEDQVSYVLVYAKDKGPKHQCPDYVSGGPNSCHFDASHTSIWKSYCMKVTAVTAHRNYSSHEHCVDVADIVQTEAPVNLTYNLADVGGDELGHNAVLSWEYPLPDDLKYGWITLEYELQYRRVTEPDAWKVKHPLRDPHVELLGLRVGDYEVRVRCRSRNNGLWSRWSPTLMMTIPSRPPTGNILVLILVVGVGAVTLLVVSFGIVPYSKRIKDYFLPPIPKPRILGIDPLLLKKGKLEEINRHFSSFHGYHPPSSSEEVWDHVTSEDVYLTTGKQQEDGFQKAGDLLSVAPGDKAPYVQSVPPYCGTPPLLDTSAVWPSPGMVPGTDYTTIEHPVRADPAPFTPGLAPQDFYTCVQLNEAGNVQLVPCLPPAYCLPPAVTPEEKERKRKMSEYQGWTSSVATLRDAADSERSEATVPLLPTSLHDTG